MDFAAIIDLLTYALDVALLGFVAYGGSLVLGGGWFHRNVPVHATHPRFDRLFTR